MSTLRFQTKSIDGKPVISFEQDIGKTTEKRKFDYKSRNQKFFIREAAGPQSLHGNDSYRGSECDSTAGRPDWNSPLKSYQRQSYRKKSESLERESQYNGENKKNYLEGERRRPRISNDEETVTLTKSQLAKLLSETGINQNHKPGSRINYADEEERRLALPLDNYQEDRTMNLSEQLARKRQQLAEKKFDSPQTRSRPPVPSTQNRKPAISGTTAIEEPYRQTPSRNKRPQAENVMGLIAKLQEEQKQAGKKKPPPPIGGFRGKDQRILQKKQAAGSDEDDELGMNNRKPKISSKQYKSGGRPNSQQYFDDDDDDDERPSNVRKHRSKYPDDDFSNEQYESYNQEKGDQNHENERREAQDSVDDPRIDAVMQRVIEENRGKLSEEDLVELLSQVYIELKKGKLPEKDEIQTNPKNSDHQTNGNHPSAESNVAKATLQTNGKSGSLMEKKRLQWEREREEMASLPGSAPWNGPVVTNDSQRMTNSRSGSQQQSTHFTNSSVDSSRPTYGRVNQMNQEVLVPRGPTGDENNAMTFGNTADETRKKEADRRAWLDGLNQQRLEQRTVSKQERERKRSIDAPNNASNINDRPF